MASVQVQIPTNITQSNQTLRANALRIALSYAGWISKLLIPKVGTFEPKEKIFWQLAMVRAVCGFLSLWAAYIIFVPATINMLVGLGIVTVWLTPYWTYKKTVQFFQSTDWNAIVNEKKQDEVNKTL